MTVGPAQERPLVLGWTCSRATPRCSSMIGTGPQLPAVRQASSARDHWMCVRFKVTMVRTSERRDHTSLDQSPAARPQNDDGDRVSSFSDASFARSIIIKRHIWIFLRFSRRSAPALHWGQLRRREAARCLRQRPARRTSSPACERRRRLARACRRRAVGLSRAASRGSAQNDACVDAATLSSSGDPQIAISARDLSQLSNRSRARRGGRTERSAPGDENVNIRHQWIRSVRSHHRK
jgi:hypothetical protein